MCVGIPVGRKIIAPAKSSRGKKIEWFAFLLKLIRTPIVYNTDPPTSIGIVLPCPWGNVWIGLSCWKLTIREKIYFEQEINSDRTKSTVIANRYNMKSDTLRKHPRRVINNILLHYAVGGLIILDPESFWIVADPQWQNDDLYSKQIYSVLMLEPHNTLLRPYPMILNTELPRKLCNTDQRALFWIFQQWCLWRVYSTSNGNVLAQKHHRNM